VSALAGRGKGLLDMEPNLAARKKKMKGVGEITSGSEKGNRGGGEKEAFNRTRGRGLEKKKNSAQIVGDA